MGRLARPPPLPRPSLHRASFPAQGSAASRWPWQDHGSPRVAMGVAFGGRRPQGRLPSGPSRGSRPQQPSLPHQTASGAHPTPWRSAQSHPSKRKHRAAARSRHLRSSRTPWRSRGPPLSRGGAQWGERSGGRRWSGSAPTSGSTTTRPWPAPSGRPAALFPCTASTLASTGRTPQGSRGPGPRGQRLLPSHHPSPITHPPVDAHALLPSTKNRKSSQWSPPPTISNATSSP